MTETTPTFACWRCGSPFFINMTHKATGHKIAKCAIPTCNAPFDLDDVKGLEIMREHGKTNPDAKRYAEHWERARSKVPRPSPPSAYGVETDA